MWVLVCRIFLNYISILHILIVLTLNTGINGLISAKTYLDCKPSANLLILDQQASIGGVWSTEQIYPTLYAQMKHGLFEYSFYPMRHEGMSDDSFISGGAIHTYLNDFAWDFDLVRQIRLETNVTNVSDIPSGGWRLSIAGKPPIECEKLIYASGATSHPVKPVWPTQSGFTAPIIHSTMWEPIWIHSRALILRQWSAVPNPRTTSYLSC